MLLSTLLIAIVAGVNFITSSHVLEAMGIANALESRRKAGLLNIQGNDDVSIIKIYLYNIIVHAVKQNKDACVWGTNAEELSVNMLTHLHCSTTLL